ncbi:hypothetical protein NZK32_12150 [Cyanobium sp. FGCU-52]|nr:hypothetical protein [Cyanobium sp. FGCU52]
MQRRLSRRHGVRLHDLRSRWRRTGSRAALRQGCFVALSSGWRNRLLALIRRASSLADLSRRSSAGFAGHQGRLRFQRHGVLVQMGLQGGVAAQSALLDPGDVGQQQAMGIMDGDAHQP